MSTDALEFPEWRGGGCQNVRCDGSNNQRILSIEEVERVYPVKDKFSWWPVPEQVTHVCTICGFCYSGISEDYASKQRETRPLQVEVDIEEWDWDHESQYEMEVREALEAFIRAAPEEVSADELAIAAGRYVTGVDPEFAREVMTAMDDYDKTALTADRFM